MKKLLLCAAVLFAAACSKPGITVKISGFDETELTVAHMYLKDYPVPNDNDPRIKKQLVTLENGKAVITPIRCRRSMSYLPPRCRRCSYV